jgi:tRNA modification GTPase
MVSERVDICGVAVNFVDTAGWRSTEDEVEREGVNRGERARDVADLVILAMDRSCPLENDDERLLNDTARMHRLVLLNKSDLAPVVSVGDVDQRAAKTSEVIEISARTGEGFDQLRMAIFRSLTGNESLRDSPRLSNERHIRLLEDARSVLLTAQDAAAAEVAEEFLLSHLQSARTKFDEIVGTRTPEDVLAHIFEKFCIGK